jgi:hypothetical protein
MVEIYFYEHRGHDEIDPAKLRVFEILEGHRLPGAYEMWWDMETSHLPDVGPIRNSTTVRQDWQIITLRRPS